MQHVRETEYVRADCFTVGELEEIDQLRGKNVDTKIILA
jgi:hypothetical protein